MFTLYQVLFFYETEAIFIFVCNQLLVLSLIKERFMWREVSGIYRASR